MIDLLLTHVIDLSQDDIYSLGIINFGAVRGALVKT